MSGRWATEGRRDAARHVVVSRHAVGRCLAGLLATMVTGCEAAVPWGEGAPGLPGARTFTVERHLDDEGLQAASEALAREASELLAVGLPLEGDGTGPVRLDLAHLPLASLAFLREPEGLALALEVPAFSLPWREASSPDDTSPETVDTCPLRTGALRLGPGRFTVPLAFATDELGRLRPRLAPYARWRGPLEVDHGPVSEGCPELDPSTLPGELTRLLPAAVDHALAPDLVPVLGFDLPAELVAHPRLAIRLRARTEAPVTPVEAGISAWFELAVHAEAAPCVAPLSPAASPAWRPAGRASSSTGLGLPVAGLEALFEAVTLAGHLCGAAPLAVPLEPSAVARLAPTWSSPFIADSPSLSPELAVPSVSAAWAPSALPVLRPDPTTSDLVLAMAGLELGLWGRWQGARWQLAAMTVSLEARLTLTLTESGALSVRLLDLAVAVPVTRSGLLPPPPVEEARALAEAFLAPGLEALPLVAMPASLTPQTARAATTRPADGIIAIPTR